MTEKEKFYSMPYIEDKTMYKAVCFALKLKDKMSIGLAIYKAAKYYRLNQKDVAYWVGMTGSRKRIKKNIYESLDNGRQDRRMDES